MIWIILIGVWLFLMADAYLVTHRVRNRPPRRLTRAEEEELFTSPLVFIEQIEREAEKNV